MLKMVAFKLCVALHFLAIHSFNKRNQGEICESKKWRKNTMEQHFNYHASSKTPPVTISFFFFFLCYFLLVNKKVF